MQTDPSRIVSSAFAGDGRDPAAQELEDWTATIALMVAGTLDPSCALTFCFGNPRYVSERLASDGSVLS